MTLVDRKGRWDQIRDIDALKEQGVQKIGRNLLQQI